MIQDVLNAVKNVLQASSYLTSVTNYHFVDGMIPGVNPTISISCNKLKYSDYDRSQDVVVAPVRIYLYAQDMQPERGETTIRNLATQIRYELVANMYLGGIADESTVTDITFESDQSQQGMLLHYALIDYEVKYYEPRQRPASDLPTAGEIDATLNSETVVINL